MWTVRGPHAVAVLFGSVHLLPPGLDWESPALKQAIAQADEIWFELPIGPATDRQVQLIASRKGRLPAGDSLFKHLTPEQVGRLRSVCASLGIPLASIAPLRPWMADVLLSVAQDMRAGARSGQGVEEQLSSQALPTTARHAFETVELQINVLADTSMSDQIGALNDTLAEISDDPGLFDRAVKEWLSADLAGLAKDAMDPIAKTSPNIYRRLVTDRNQRWADILSERLKGGGAIVVVVGSGHLLGPAGVPALLRARGYAVEGP